MSLSGAVRRRISYLNSSNAASLCPQNSAAPLVLLRYFSSAPLLRNEPPIDSSSASPSPSPSLSEGSPSNPFPQIPTTVKSRTIVGTVARIHTNTAYIEHTEQTWYKHLQKHFKKTTHNLVHDPVSLLRVGDVVRYSTFTPEENAAREKHRDAILNYEEAKGVKTGRGQSATHKGFVVPDGKMLVMVGAKLKAIPKQQRNSRGVRFVAREVVSPFGTSIAQRFGSIKKASWLQDLQKRSFHSYSAVRVAALDTPADAAAADVAADAGGASGAPVIQNPFSERLQNASSPEERAQIFREVLKEHKRHVKEERAKHGENFVYDRIFIADILFGALVGPKWSTKDRMQRESGATIRAAKPLPKMGPYQLNQLDVYGSREAVDKAKDLIHQRLEAKLEQIKYAGNWARNNNAPANPRTLYKQKRGVAQQSRPSKEKTTSESSESKDDRSQSNRHSKETDDSCEDAAAAAAAA